jgi:hypothetical protein
MTTKARVANGDGGPAGGHYLGLINSGAIALLIAMFAGFWSLADPRGELKTIRESFLTLREHNEFAARVQLDTVRLDKVNGEQWRELVTMREWLVWKADREASLNLVQKHLDGVVMRPELEALVAKQTIIIDSLRREIDQIDKVINARIGPIAPVGTLK